MNCDFGLSPPKMLSLIVHSLVQMNFCDKFEEFVLRFSTFILKLKPGKMRYKKTNKTSSLRVRIKNLDPFCLRGSGGGGLKFFRKPYGVYKQIWGLVLKDIDEEMVVPVM